MRALLALVCLVALAGCSEGETSAKPGNEETPNALTRTGACSTSEFDVEFTQGRVVVTSDGKELGHATGGNRDLTDACRADLTPGDAGGSLTGSAEDDTSLACKTPSAVSINVHPLQKAGDPDILGSGLVVYVTPPGRPVRLVVFARLNRDGASDRLSYDPEACSQA